MIQKRTLGTKTFVIPDTIEGWADSLGVLMSSYFEDNQPFPEYAGYEIKFDYSLIRPKGAFLSGGFKAPGPDGLRSSLDKIEGLIENWLKTQGSIIRPILCYDIICLDGETRICLSDGSKRKVKDIVKNKECLEVVSYNEVTKKYENKKINGWHKNKYEEANWMRVEFENPLLSKHGSLGGWFTHNHKFLTRDGYKEIQNLTDNDWILSGEYDLSYNAKQLILGSLMGDGSIHKRGKGSFSVTHTEPQREYINFKKEILQKDDIYSSSLERVMTRTIKNREYAINDIRISTKAVYSISNIYSFVVENGKKTISKEWMDLIDPMGLAFWYMDDGTLSKKLDRKNGHVEFATFNMSRDKVEIIQSMLFDKYSISSVIDTINPTEINGYKKIHYKLRLNNFESVKFWDLIKTYIPTCMDYKLPEIFRGYYEENIKGYDKEPLYIKVKTIKKINKIKVPKTSFCIDVEDNHNFLTMSGIVHNCHASDSVLSGSVRRSALIMLLDPNDKEMMEAKTGNWRQDNPQRARSNNSVLIHRKNDNREFFDKVVGINDGDSDLGFIFANSWFDLSNPCLSATSKILTKNGKVNISTLDDGQDHIFINAFGTEVTGKVKLTGFKPTITLNLSNGNKLTCTNDHVFLDIEGNEVTAELTKGLQLTHFSYNDLNFDDNFVKYGFIQGDGCLSRLKSKEHRGIEVNLGEDDEDVRKFFGITSTDRVYYLSDGTREELIELGFSSETLPTRDLPTTINEWTERQKLAFLRGLWSANGCLIKNTRISFKSTCKKLIEQLTAILSEFDISSYYTTNKPTKVKFKNGEYLCKESYDLNIGSYENMVKFNNLIGFIHEYKNQELSFILRLKSPKVRTIIKNKGIEPVYDFTLNDMTHVGVVNGVLTHNCAEIGFTPVNTNEDVTSISYKDVEQWTRKNIDLFGVQMCNLTSINAEKMTSKEIFLRSCKDAAFLGTLQSAYVNFPYLSKASEDITKREALLGVSMTGWMNNPKMFDAELLRVGSDIVKETNKIIAKKIGINQSARTTCTKPEGNLSVCAQTSSGIHPEHSERYFRIMQLNKGADTAKWLEQNMPFLLEESVWSASKTDYVVFIPVTNPKGGLFKKDMKGVKHLELVKLVQENWVMNGTNKELGISDNIFHNVSCTIIIDDKKQICDYIWENKNIFTGISFISDYGDKDFNQAPFTSVLTHEEIIERYGKASLFASGLIVDGLHYFNQNLWQACDCLKDKTIPVGGTREEALLRKSWLDRAKKFAKNYFKGDLVEMVYCLKDIALFHKWETINRQMKEVDFSKILMKPEYKDVSEYGAIGCSGGSCDLTRI